MKTEIIDNKTQDILYTLSELIMFRKEDYLYYKTKIYIVSLVAFDLEEKILKVNVNTITK